MNRAERIILFLRLLSFGADDRTRQTIQKQNPAEAGFCVAALA
jgi:hypothetical protein